MKRKTREREKGDFSGGRFSAAAHLTHSESQLADAAPHPSKESDVPHVGSVPWQGVRVYPTRLTANVAGHSRREFRDSDNVAVRPTLSRITLNVVPLIRRNSTVGQA
jgi:hypothetical protein